MMQVEVGSGSEPVPPSNSRGTCSNYGHGSFGIDRASVTFPLAKYEHEALAWARKSTTKDGTPDRSESLSQTVELTEGLHVHVAVFRNDWASGTGRIEFNPSRLLDPGGHTLAPVESLRTAILVVLDSVSHLVIPAISVDEVRVTRLDVARDFRDVENPTLTLSALIAMPRKWARTGVVHFDPKGLGTETLSIASGTAGMTRLYDKWIHTSGAVPPGTVRFEAECRKPWLKAYGKIKLLGDVTQERVEILALNRWEWSQMGIVTVGDPEDLVAAVRRLGLKGMDALALVGWLVAQSTGGGIRPASRTTEAKLRRLARDAGVALASDVTLSRRLDFPSGREIVEAV